MSCPVAVRARLDPALERVTADVGSDAKKPAVVAAVTDWENVEAPAKVTFPEAGSLSVTLNCGRYAPVLLAKATEVPAALSVIVMRELYAAAANVAVAVPFPLTFPPVAPVLATPFVSVTMTVVPSVLKVAVSLREFRSMASVGPDPLKVAGASRSSRDSKHRRRARRP